MTTKELIKHLKKADTSGKLHVRIRGTGCPYFLERNAGYWDGSYCYIDDNKDMIITSSGYKVDIYCIDYEDYILNHKGDYSRIKLDKGKEAEWIDRFQEVSREYKECMERLNGKK